VASTWKDWLRERLPWPAYWRLKRIREEWRAFFSSGTLTSYAAIYKTDKWGKHRYTDIYNQWLHPFRYKPVRLLEIGVGGVAKPDRGGNSLRMWKRYFNRGHIVGIDIHDKSRLAESRIHIYRGDQSDASFLKTIHDEMGPFDIIVDDGSHIQHHVIASFEVLFPLLKSGGIYIIEDTQTSYWPSFEGSTKDMYTVPSIMNYIIARVHDINAVEWIVADLPKEKKRSLSVSALAFYHNLIILQKE
jgi:hypothetical protein